MTALDGTRLNTQKMGKYGHLILKGRCPMTEAGWTRERPTKNGWYWWRFDASTSATIVRIMVCGDGSLAEMSNNGHLLLAANFDGEWLGPISPTDRQRGRVEGLREAAGMVDDDCYIDGGELLPDFEHRCKHNVNQKELAGKIRFRANALAQAQDDQSMKGEQ